MKILGVIWTLNDDHVIDRSLDALLTQKHPLNEILIVDNASTDGTLARSFPKKVTIIRHPKNLGTSGGAHTGIKYGLERGYDWVWTFDADSAPQPDALQKLIALYESFPADLQDHVRVVACLAKDVVRPRFHHGIVYTPEGFEFVDPDPEQAYYECDTNIWSGSLFRVQAVRDVGLPRVDYVLDWGDYEYGYRGMKKHYRTFVHQGCIMDHNIGEAEGPEEPKERVGQIGPLQFHYRELTPFRLYFLYRNMTHFFLHEYFCGNVFRFVRFAGWMPRHILKLVLVGQIGSQLISCIKGFSDGLRKDLHSRY